MKLKDTTMITKEMIKKILDEELDVEGYRPHIIGKEEVVDRIYDLIIKEDKSETN